MCERHALLSSRLIFVALHVGPWKSFQVINSRNDLSLLLSLPRRKNEVTE
jgi:hypothetical protein